MNYFRQDKLNKNLVEEEFASCMLFVMTKHPAHENDSPSDSPQNKEFQIARIAGRSTEIDPARLQIDIYRNEIGELMIRMDDPIRSEFWLEIAVTNREELQAPRK